MRSSAVPLSSLDEPASLLLLLSLDRVWRDAVTLPGKADTSDASKSRKTSEVRPMDSSSSLTLAMIFFNCEIPRAFRMRDTSTTEGRSARHLFVLDGRRAEIGRVKGGQR
jgi:hypothetical protein